MALLVYAIYLAVCTLTAYVLYGLDKKKAEKGAGRISEKRLLLVSFFGGAVGGLLGMRRFRHKTKHWYFYAVNFLGAFWQIAVLGFLCLYPDFLIG